MRAPFQILAIPYRVEPNLMYAVLHRSDCDQWQFIAGGGEDDETPLMAAKREIFEEAGVSAEDIMELVSMSYVPANVISDRHRRNWPKDTYVLPEYSFAFACKESLILSREHRECRWVSFEEAMELLQWDSNKTALYELNCRLSATNP